jgi:NADPH2:quinone reductase
MQAIEIRRTGGPEVMELVDIELGPPGPGQALVRNAAIGVNYRDIYLRTGLYEMPLPGRLGSDAAGTVQAVGPGVTAVRPGDRVVYISGGSGTYATHTLVDADSLVLLPPEIAADVATAIWLRGTTAEFLVERCARIRRGDTVLVTAAAGGVGLLLCQWLSHLGARTVGVVGSEAKVAEAKAAGADEVLVGYAGMSGPVRERTGGRGVDVVLDSVGRDSFAAALDCLRPRGLMVTYGNASGPVDPVAPALLAAKGSLFLTRPILFDYIGDPAERRQSSARLLELVGAGVLRARIGQTYGLAEAAKAHADMEARRTTGATILIP